MGETAAQAIVSTLFANLPVGADLGYGYVLREISAGEIIRLTAEKAGAPLRIWVSAARADTPSYRSSARFRIGYEGKAPEKEALRAVDRVIEEITRNEAQVSDTTYRNFDAGIGFPLGMLGEYDGLGDLQWLGVRAGLKPACRQSFSGAAVQRVIARAQAAGLYVECLPAADYLAAWLDVDDGSDDTLIFVGATPAAAKAALEAERTLARSSLEARRSGLLRQALLQLRTRKSDDALGKALGYPRCCVKFFVPRVAYSIPELHFAALKRTQGPASFLLNNIDLNRALIPHYVCRYDCAASIEYAGALLRELERVDPAGATALANSLHGLLILFRSGGYVWMRGRTADEPRTLGVAGVSWSGEWPDRSTWIEAAERSDQVVVEPRRLTFLADGGRAQTFDLPPKIGMARIFG